MQITMPEWLTRAELDPASIDTKNRRVKVTWSTGATVRRDGEMLGQPYYEELDMSPGAVRMGRLQSGTCPVTRGHESDLGGVIGVVESASLDNGIGEAWLRFSRRAEVDPIWQDVQDKILRNVSLGAVPFKAKVVGTHADGLKIIRLTDWEPRAIGVVPLGADPGAVIRGAGQTVCELEDPQEQPASRPGPAVRLLRLALEITQETL